MVQHLFQISALHPRLPFFSDTDQKTIAMQIDSQTPCRNGFPAGGGEAAVLLFYRSLDSL